MGSGESLLPGLSRAAFSLCPHSGGGGGRKGEGAGREEREGGRESSLYPHLHPTTTALGVRAFNL